MKYSRSVREVTYSWWKERKGKERKGKERKIKSQMNASSHVSIGLRTEN
jgi:hypothetical protein